MSDRCGRCGKHKAGGGYCKECRAEYMQDWKKNHPEAMEIYKQRAKEKKNTWSIERKEQDRKRRSEYKRQYLKDHPEARRKHNNRPCAKACRARAKKKYWEKHPEKLREKQARIMLAPAGMRGLVPIEIVELKVLQLALSRELRRSKEA